MTYFLTVFISLVFLRLHSNEVKAKVSTFVQTIHTRYWTQMCILWKCTKKMLKFWREFLVFALHYLLGNAYELMLLFVKPRLDIHNVLSDRTQFHERKLKLLLLIIIIQNMFPCVISQHLINRIQTGIRWRLIIYILHLTVTILLCYVEISIVISLQQSVFSWVITNCSFTRSQILWSYKY